MQVLFTLKNHITIKPIIKHMEQIPRIGDTVPLFYSPAPKVVEVVWFPEELMNNTKTLVTPDGIKIDVFIYLD